MFYVDCRRTSLLDNAFDIYGPRTTRIKSSIIYDVKQSDDDGVNVDDKYIYIYVCVCVHTVESILNRLNTRYGKNQKISIKNDPKTALIRSKSIDNVY